MKVSLPSVVISDEANELVAKVQHFVFLRENNSIFSERNTVILSSKNMGLKVSSIFINIHQPTVRHLLTIWMMMNGDATRASTEQ